MKEPVNGPLGSMLLAVTNCRSGGLAQPVLPHTWAAAQPQVSSLCWCQGRKLALSVCSQGGRAESFLAGSWVAVHLSDAISSTHAISKHLYQVLLFLCCEGHVNARDHAVSEISRFWHSPPIGCCIIIFNLTHWRRLLIRSIPCLKKEKSSLFLQ